MPIAREIRDALSSSSMIRKMFEEGIRLKKEHGADKVFDFSLGNPDLDPPAAFHQVFTRLAQEDRSGSHGYMPNPGYPEVREALAKKASREQGVPLEGAHVIMSVGAAGALNTIFKTILDPGDEVVVSRPYFMEYRPYTANHGGLLVEADSRPDFSLDLEAIAQKLSPRTAAVLINSPNNPTGRVYPAADLSGLSRLLLDHGKATGRYPYLVADEPYREIVYPPVTVPPVLAAYPHSLVATSYSKNLSLPGERIGYIAVNPAMDGLEEMLRGLVHCTRVLGYINAPALMQRIVAELTEERAAVEVYRRRRDAFKDVLDRAKISYVEPEGAFYLFCRAPGGDDAAFVEHLKRHLILGVPGSGFRAPGWVRFAYCVGEEVIRASAPAFARAMSGYK